MVNHHFTSVSPLSTNPLKWIWDEHNGKWAPLCTQTTTKMYFTPFCPNTLLSMIRTNKKIYIFIEFVTDIFCCYSSAFFFQIVNIQIVHEQISMQWFYEISFRQGGVNASGGNTEMLASADHLHALKPIEHTTGEARVNPKSRIGPHQVLFFNQVCRKGMYFWSHQLR